MAGCDDIRPLLSPYYDGELDRAAAERVAAHVAGCRACRAELDGFARLSADLRAGRSCQPDVDLWPGIASRALALRRRRRRRLWFTQAAAVAAGFLLYLAGYAAVRPRSAAPAGAPSAAEPQPPAIEIVLRDTADALRGRAVKGEAFAALAERPEARLVQELTEGRGP